jgi:hypothetical protein
LSSIQWHNFILRSLAHRLVGVRGKRGAIHGLFEHFRRHFVSIRPQTIPIYICATVFSLATSLSSDYFQERAFHIAVPATVSCVLFIAECYVTNNTARYVMLCFAASGIWTALPQILAWFSNVVSYPAEKKSISQALINGVGNTASIYGAYIWPSTSGPQYRPGNAATAAFTGSCAALALLGLWLHKRYPYEFGQDESAKVSPEEVREESMKKN